jgi:uncharacterized protein YlzI (FlbEa/FlbD family)
MPWIIVTTPTGKKAWLNTDHCSRVRLPVPGEIGHTVIDLADGRTQAVDETVEEVGAAIYAAATDA